MVQFPIASPTNYTVTVARVSEVFKTMEHSIYAHFG